MECTRQKKNKTKKNKKGTNTWGQVSVLAQTGLLNCIKKKDEKGVYKTFSKVSLHFYGYQIIIKCTKQKFLWKIYARHSCPMESSTVPGDTGVMQIASAVSAYVIRRHR